MFESLTPTPTDFVRGGGVCGTDPRQGQLGRIVLPEVYTEGTLRRDQSFVPGKNDRSVMCDPGR